ncbi:MAG: FAD-binding protein [Chloroflexota bacterium]
MPQINTLSLPTLAKCKAIFPDLRILRTHLIWGLFANLAFIDLLNNIGLGLGFSFSFGVLYIVLVTLYFLPTAPLLSLIAGGILFLSSSLFSAPILWNVAILAVSFWLIVIIPYIWRDRIHTGLYEGSLPKVSQATLGMLPSAFWQFFILNMLELGWRPTLSEQIQACIRSRYFMMTNQAWHNWAKTSQSSPKFIFQPETLADLQTIVQKANTQQLKVRIVGSSYSWPNWATTSDILVYSGRLNKVEIDLSIAGQPRIIAEAGATNRQLNNVLEQHGLALPSNVVLEVVRIGGIVSTGSHGSGWHHPVLSDYVHALDIVTADGQCRRFEVGKDSDDIMNAVRLSLGTFGLIWRVTLNVQPNWHVRLYDYRCSTEMMLNNIREWVTTYDAVDVFYFPYCRDIWIMRQERLDITENPVSLRHSTFDLLWSSLLMALWQPCHFIMHRFPALTPIFSRLFFRAVPFRDIQTPVMDWIHHHRSVDAIALQNVEIAFKLNDQFESFFQAWQDFEAITEAYAKQGKYTLNIAFNARFIGESGALLSPAHGEGHTCYIEILSSANTPYWAEYSAALAEAWLQLPQAAPHWPKQWEHIPNIDTYLRKRYAKNIRKFIEIREELAVDPNNIFVNDLCQRLMDLAD